MSTSPMEKRVAALEAEAKANKGRIQTIITRLNQAVGAYDPANPKEFLNQLRDLATDLSHTVQ